jgi:hypothetical protein
MIHTIYYSGGMALCGIALIMILVAFLKGKGKKDKKLDD